VIPFVPRCLARPIPAGAALMAAALAASTHAQQPANWHFESNKNACEVTSGPLDIGTRDGSEFLFGVTKGKMDQSFAARIRIDDEPLSLAFQPIKGGVLAVLSGDDLLRLSYARRLQMEWPGTAPVDISMQDFGQAVATMADCGKALEVARAQAAERARARGRALMAFGQALQGAAAAMPSRQANGGDSGGSTSGLMCIKSGEFVSGMNRICSYRCGVSAYARTIGAAEMCPISIN
jgi:hypothetical protein